MTAPYVFISHLNIVLDFILDHITQRFSMSSWTLLPAPPTKQEDETEIQKPTLSHRTAAQMMKLTFASKTERLEFAIARNEWDTDAWIALLNENKNYEAFLGKFPSAVFFYCCWFILFFTFTAPLS